MKKITKSLLLTAALFSLAACSVPFSSVNSSNNGQEAVHGNDEATYSITYTKDDAVTVSGPSTATKGSKVTFSIAYDSEEYVIDEIKVNNDKPFSEGNNSFSFRMPEGAVIVEVKGHYADPNHGKYQILNVNADKGVVLFGANEYAAEGETVSFTVKFAYDTPYTFTDVVTATYGEDATELPVTARNNEFSFVMPAAKVSVIVGLEANQYKITLSNTEKSNNFAGTPFAFLNEGGGYTNLYAEYFDDHNTYYVAYGETVRAKVKNSSDRLVIQGIKLLGSFGSVTTINELEPVPEEEYSYATFTMPAGDIAVEAYGDINYKTVTVVNADHYQATLQTKVDDALVDIDDYTQIVPGDVVYVAISPIGEPDEDYEFEKVTLSDGYLSTDTAGSLYHFTMSNKDNVTVTVTEKNMAQWKNYDFVGKHYGANLYSTGSGKTAAMSSYHSATITGDGTVVRGGTNTYTIASVSEENNGSFGVVTTTDNKQFAYSGKFIFGHYSFNTNYSGGFGNDWHVSVLADEADSMTDYKFYYQIDTNKTFIAVQAFKIVNEEEVLHAVMLYDKTNIELYSKGVTFEFESGTRVSEATATYNVV